MSTRLKTCLMFDQSRPAVQFVIFQARTMLGTRPSIVTFASWRKKNPEIKLGIESIFHKLELHTFYRSMHIGTSLKLMYLPARTLQSHGQEGNRWRVQWRIHLTKRHRQAMGPSSSQDLWASIQHHLYGYPCGTRHQLQPLVELNASMGSPLVPLKQLLLISA